MNEDRTVARRRTLLGVLVLALAAVCGVAGVSSSGAWFTAQQSATAQVTGATLSIGPIGRQQAETIHISDVFPMTDQQAAVSGASPSEWITVRNTGSLTVDWTLGLVGATPSAPLTTNDLALFRARLFDASGTPLGQVFRLSDLPATSVPGSQLTSGAGLAPGAGAPVEIRLWLDPSAGDRFQGASAQFTVVVNVMQTGAARATPLAITATPAGTPSGAQTTVNWTDATSLVQQSGASGTPVYTVERSTSADFADAVQVYRGSALTVTDASTSEIPTRISAAQVSANGMGSSSWAVVDGAVYGWGTVTRGVPAPTGATWFSAGTPTKLSGVVGTAKKVAAGTNHVCVLTTDARVFCAGFGSAGQLGDGRATSFVASTSTSTSDLATSAVEVVDTSGVFRGKTIVDVTAGNEFSCALTSDGTVGCWGSSAGGKIGRAPVYGDSSVPVPVTLNTGAKPVGIASSYTSTCVSFARNDVTSGNDVRCWGGNTRYEIGGQRSQTSAVAMPDSQGLLRGTVAIAAGTSGYCVVTDATATTNVACWGDNSYGELGTGTTTPSATPVRLATSSPVRFDRVAMGIDGACGSAGATIQCWGTNLTGILGSGSVQSLGDAPRQTAPVADAASALGSGTVTSLGMGTDHACATTSGGALACWGSDRYFQRGQASATAGGTSVSPASVLVKTSTGATTPLVETAAVCASGAPSIGGTACGLLPGTRYWYRVSYTIAGAPGWSSAPVSVRR